MASNGIYIYGIVHNLYDSKQFSELINSDVTTISFQNISAIISETYDRPLEDLSKDSLAHLLVHHQKTIEMLMGKGVSAVLPMRLGTIAGNRHEVRRILETGYKLIMDTLEKMEGKIEIDLVATWANFSDILDEVSQHPEITALKNDILKNQGLFSQTDKVKLGMLVQSVLKEKNKTIELEILDELSSFSLDVKIHDTMNDQMVTNSAFLVNRAKLKKFEQAIGHLDEKFKGALNFKLVGPLPCYSFATIEVKELNHEHIELAKNELGIGEEFTEPAIKKAYLEKARLFHPDVSPDNGGEDNFNKINKAYRTLVEYSTAAKQSSKDNSAIPAKEKAGKNLILVKIRE